MWFLEGGYMVWLVLSPWTRKITDVGGATYLYRHEGGPVPEDYPDYFVGEDPPVAAGDHCVLEFEGWFIDLTARQFDPDLPFPFFWRPIEPQ